MYNSMRAKKELRTKLETDSRVHSIVESQVPYCRDAWKMETDDSTKVAWMKFSQFAGDPTRTESPFYGSTWNVTNKLRNNHSLYLMFLGRTDKHRWTVPFPDLVSRFTVSDKDGGDEWRFNFDQGAPLNH